MQLSLQTFTTLVQNMAAAVQSAASQLVDLTVGSALRAILEANASVALWMQWLILQVLQMTRAATSSGPDLDSWMADFSLQRLPACAATGIAAFSRYTATGQALIPAASLVRTADGSQTFAVTIDPTNPAWSPSQNGYALATGVATLNVPIAAQIAGTVGNVQAGAITMLASALPGIDTVTNPAPLQNGLDAETDDALRSRFRNFIASRSRATPDAIGYAVVSVQQGLAYAIAENLNPAGIPQMGSFVVTVDDGSGSPPASLLSTISTAVEAVRPVGSIFTVQPPSVLQANVSVTLGRSSGASPAVTAAVANAISRYVDALPIGAPLALTRIAQIAYATSPTVTNVSQMQINGCTADLVPPASGVLKAGTIAVA